MPVRARSLAVAALLAAPALPLAAQAPAGAPVVADDDFYKQKNCFACHRLDRVEYAPAFRSIAARYAGDTTAVARLAAKVRAGGGGVWGPDAMPAQTQVTEAEALALVRWILALRSTEE